MNSEPFSIEGALKGGWRAFMARPLFWVGVQLVVVVIQVVFEGLGQAVAPDPLEASFMGSLISLIISLVAYGIWARLTMGYIYMSLKAVDGGVPVFNDLLAKGHLFWRYLGASILFSIGVSIGALLLIIPGLYLLICFGLFGYGMVDREVAVMDSFKLASRLTEGYRWQLLGLGLVFVVINVVAMIPFFLGLLVSVPFTMLTGAFVYRHLGGTSAGGI